MDIFSGDFETIDGNLAYRIGQASIPLPKEITYPNQTLDMGVRPEFVMLGSSGFPASVRLVQPVGPFTYVTVDWQGGSVTARVNGVSHLKVKENLHVEFDPTGMLFFDRESEKRRDI